MACIKSILGCFDNFVNRDLGYYDIHLDLRKERCFYGNTSVVLLTAFLYAAAEYVGNCHSGDADLHKSRLQDVKLRLLADDLDLGVLMTFLRLGEIGNCLDFDSLSLGSIACNCYGVVAALKDGLRLECESCISWRKAVLCRGESFDLFVSGSTETDGLFDDYEYDDHRNCCPGDDGTDTEELYAEDLHAFCNVTAVDGCIDRAVDSCGSRLC